MSLPVLQERRNNYRIYAVGYPLNDIAGQSRQHANVRERIRVVNTRHGKYVERVSIILICESFTCLTQARFVSKSRALSLMRRIRKQKRYGAYKMV